MEKAFEEELQHNYKHAWIGYLRKFCESAYCIFKHASKYQRTVKCCRCGVKIPKQVPRIYFDGSWYYYRGHYCLKCAEAQLKIFIEDREDLLDLLTKNLKHLKEILSIIQKTQEKERYKELMSLGYLITKIQ